jgi:D-alanyl-D-alanine carboxypeptidase
MRVGELARTHVRAALGALRSVRIGTVGAIVVGILPIAAHAQYRGEISSIVLDANTGAVLQQDAPTLQRFPASLTKLMTLYMVFEALRDRRITIDQAVPVSEFAAGVEPSKLGLLPGTYITVEQAILALVTKSANDAATALGEMLGGDEQRFGQMMTLRARGLGMSQTTFRNASGLPDPDQMTTAGDLALLARHLIADFPDQYHYFSVPGFWFHGRLVPNHDGMLRSYPGADGLKTGFTDAAGCNLVTSAVRGNVRLIGVVLGAQNNGQRAQVMTNLLNGGFAQEGVPVPAALPPQIFASASRHHRMLMASDDVPVSRSPISHGRHHLFRVAGVGRRHVMRMQAAVTEAVSHRGGARVHMVRATRFVGRHHVRRMVAERATDPAA